MQYSSVLFKASAVCALLSLGLSACSDKPKAHEQQEQEVAQADAAKTDVAQPENDTMVDTAKASTDVGDELPVAEFEVHGNEPFWRVEVHGDKLIYSTPDTPKGKQLPAERLAYAKGVEYSGELDGVKYTLNINGAECFDDMSSESFEMTATFDYGDQTLKGCAERI